ncbi:MAG: hypothetical protein NWF14_06885 [Candidatus Bathyarchaeota archaeon]|nr:hypothetical protein [Candidatus Bathyarchaeota archaeon]
MNKKLSALLIPLLLLSVVSLASAHWTDTVYKQYKFRFGTVEVEIKKWHVDLVKIWDANSDGVIFGQELNVTEAMDDHTPPEVIGLQISASPVGPGFTLELKMIVHNKGRLPIEVEAPLINYSVLYDEDPCFTWIPVDNQTSKPAWLMYTTEYFAHNDSLHDGHDCYDPTHFTILVAATARVYEPCESVLVKQYILMNVQEYPDLQCHWFRIDVIIPVRNSAPSTDSSLSGTEGW